MLRLFCYLLRDLVELYIFRLFPITRVVFIVFFFP